MKPILFALAAGLSLFASGGVASAQAEAPQIGRCRMGGCAWFRIEERETVRTVVGERLVRIRAADGDTEHPDDRYPTSAAGLEIDWTPAADLYFLCSTARPSVIMSGDGRWSAIRLDLVHVAGATEFVSVQYVAACHPGDDLNRPGFAARHGYAALTDEAEERSLARPGEIFEGR